jgi:glutathione S-transferase
VPAIKDNEFTLFESHAILKYLATTRKVADHWYPLNPMQRAKIDCYLDWHHSNLRRTAAPLVFNTVFAPSMGLKVEFDIQNGKKLNEKNLTFINDFWLGETPFIAQDQISIADLSAYEEILSLTLIDYDFSKHKNVVKWLDTITKLPESVELHKPFNKVKNML